MIEAIDPILIAAATADGGDITNWPPILQVFGGMAVFVIMLLTYLKGQRSEAKSERPAGGVEVYADGPVLQIISEVKKIASAIERAAEAAPDVNALREECSEKLSKSRREMFDRLEKQEERMRQLERDVAVLQSRTGPPQQRR